MAVCRLAVFTDHDAAGVAANAAGRVRRSIHCAVNVQDFLRAGIHAGDVMPFVVIDGRGSREVRGIKTAGSPGNVA